MAARITSRTRTAVIGATLTAGAITGAVALGGAAYADTPATSAVADSFISESEYDAALPFFEAGYTYEDAATLAEGWKTPSVYDAKISAGEKLAAGETLPLEPSGPATTAEVLAEGIAGDAS